MITLNAAHLSASKPSSSVARIRWPVDDTGRNSVTPSTMPRMIAMMRIGTSGRCGDAGAPSEAVARKAAEPLSGDGGERRRLNPERLESGRALRRHIVALEHQ